MLSQNRVTFIPALFCPEAFFKTRKYVLNGFTFNCRFWEHDALYYYPMVMFSYEIYKKYTLTTDYGVTDETFLIGDSGGSSIATRGVEIDALSVLRWYERNNIQIGMSLDYPPTTGSRAVDVDDNLFAKRLTRSAKASEIFQTYLQSPNLKIYNIIHSSVTKDKYKRMSMWWDALSKFDSSGYAVAPKPRSSPLSVAFDLCFLLERGIKKNVHVLGITGFRALIPIVYASKWIENLTVDSATFGVAMSKALIFLYEEPRIKIEKGSTGGKCSPIDVSPCICPVCEKIPLKYVPLDYTARIAMAVHNIWVTVNYIRFLSAFMQDKEKFKELIEIRYPKTSKVLELMDEMVDRGVEKVWSRQEANLQNFL